MERPSNPFECTRQAIERSSPKPVVTDWIASEPGTERAEHLSKVQVPMLFLQGTRDTLADLDLLRPICAQLEPLSTLHVVNTADHSFHVLKSSGKSDPEVIHELADTVGAWADRLQG